MADVTHLERMGRELKCPICLSLLNSSVSLTCNHVFCNSCIEKSMKLTSDCPVCKVPYMRREIRPAPHMDNLVSVYKSMEVESGFSINVTQNAASTKMPGEDDQIGDNIHEAQDNGEAQMVNPESGNRNKIKKKGFKRASLTNQMSPGLSLAKPAFPTKKRVQVPRHSTSETQIRHEELDNKISGTDKNKPEKAHILQNGMPPPRKKGKPEFAPFFWLREEVDSEKLSQQTDGDQEMYTPPEVPCFSDIKESDDDLYCIVSPKGGIRNTAEFVDSELFEWTQTPCSPELRPDSLAMQSEDTIIRAERKGAVTSIKPTKSKKLSPKKRKAIGKTRIGKDAVNSGIHMCNGKISGTTDSRQTKRTKKSASEVISLRVEAEVVTNQDMPEKSDDINKMLRTQRKTRKTKTIISEDHVKKATADEAFSPSDGIDHLAESSKIAAVDLSVSENCKRSRESSLSKKGCKSGEIAKKLKVQQEKVGGKVKAGKYDTVNDQKKKIKANEIVTPHLTEELLPLRNPNEISDKGVTNKTGERSRKEVSKFPKKVTFSAECMSTDNGEGLNMSNDAEVAVTGQRTQENQLTKNRSGVKALATMDKPKSTLDGILRKCKTFPSAIHCAFCQSSEESEASGVMVHYLEGKMVSDSNDAVSIAVHVHRYCTEWAPNVYFDDENVMNLENELSRSRRIKCSLCGKKGAALGCFEKSCRKSFHVTCARLTPGCRWDFDNFVMLCTLHASCKLPNETTESQSTQKRKQSAESISCNNQEKPTCEVKSSLILPWKAQKGFKNLVICCSALTDKEKDIVNEFEKLSGVNIVKNWDSSVTHVIASTDENGACRRTLKFLMGVLEGKWILSVQWLKACMEAVELVDEQTYEIKVDIHGIKDGPKLGRLRLLNKQTRLFEGLKFFFMGDFAPSYKGYLHDLVIGAGGKVLNRKPIEEGNAFIIYSVEIPDKCTPSKAISLLNDRRADAKAVADGTGSLVATNSWILNSIAGYKLQPI